ncbi:MAG: TonB-dependent receptor [Daejeonella sp.]
MDKFYQFRTNFKPFFILLIGFSFFNFTVFAQQNGKITGKITDAEMGETVIGATVKIIGTAIGAASNVDGIYTLNTVNPGTYSIEISYISYQKKTIADVIVTAGKTTNLDIVLETSTSSLNEVVVRGQRLTGTEIAVFAEIRNSVSIANGVSSQVIQRSGDSDAAQVVRRVPGITIVDNRFINIRGLSERYNSVQLNNVVAPSLETDIRSFSFDLIPSSQIDRVLVYKSPSADLPADFAGGVVKVFVKSVPDQDMLNIDYGTSYRQDVTFKTFNRPTSGGMYYSGFNMGDNDLPTNFPRNLRTISASFRNAAGHALANSWMPAAETGNLDQKLNIFGSKRFNFNNKLLGNITALSYSNSKTNNDVTRGDYNTFDANSQTASPIYTYSDNQYNYNVRLGIIHNWAFNLNDRHTFEFKNLYNQLSTSQYINRTGRNLEAAYSPDSYSSSNLYRGVYSGQITGNHKFNSERTKADWVIGYGQSYRDQPDYKRYRSDINETTGERTLYVPTGAAAAEFLGRFYSRMDEDVKTGAFNIEQGLSAKETVFKPVVKIGGYFEDKNRLFTSRNIGYVRANSSLFNSSLLNGSISDLFSWENINTNTGIRIDEQSNPNDNYTSTNRLLAGYANLILPYQAKLTLVAGTRIENNVQTLVSADDQGPVNVNNDITRILPSANLAYNVTSKALIRLAYGQTLNRPEFRELAPFSFYDFDLNFTNKGNPTLKTAKIENYDLKYEFYPSASELISVSAFYKRFKDPIETIFVPGAGSGGAKTFTYGNAKSADNMGIELEVRKSLAGITNSQFIDDLTLMVNASYIDSKIELGSIAAGQSNERPLQGQAPYIVNTALFYNNLKNKWQVNILYNVIGKRIAYIGYDGYPDIYEMPRNVLDLTVSKTLSNKLTLRANFNDLLNQETTLLQDGNADGNFDRKNDQIISGFKSGRLFGLTLGYKIF